MVVATDVLTWDVMEHYQVPGLNTIRQAQLLVDDGLVETRQGVGSFVIRIDPVPRPVEVLAELRTARSALNRAIAALEKAGLNELPGPDVHISQVPTRKRADPRQRGSRVTGRFAKRATSPAQPNY